MAAVAGSRTEGVPLLNAPAPSPTLPAFNDAPQQRHRVIRLIVAVVLLLSMVAAWILQAEVSRALQQDPDFDMVREQEGDDDPRVAIDAH